MSPTGLTSESPPASALAGRFAEFALPLVAVEADGAMTDRWTEACGPVHEMVVAAPLFERELRRQARRWSDEAVIDPALVTLWPGCHVVPLPTGRRRRERTTLVGVILTDALFSSEQFHHIADANAADFLALQRSPDRHRLMSEEQARVYARLLPPMAADLHQQQRTRDEIDSLSRQLAETYEELSLVYKLSARMTVTEAPASFLEEALNELQEVVGLRWLTLLLIDDDRRLGPMSGKLITVGRLPVGRESLRRIAGDALREVAPDDAPMVLHDDGPWRHTPVGRLAEQVLFVPLIGDDRPLGLILGADKADGSDLSSVDSKLVTSVAQNVAIFLENAMLYEDVQDMFMGMLRSLVNAIDAKDTYTCGHSERVAWLGRELGKAAGLDDHTVERLYLSGLLHDVGKIGVPESVLTKPGKLTDREFTIIKAHPRIGARIVEGVRQMQDLIPGVLYHHERYDGRGYPDGLAGEQIPLFGRLLALADSFDAMSSNRTYRTAMPLDEVLEEVRRCAGKQFDPELAAVFQTLDFAPFQEMVRTHQQRQSLLRRELGDEV